MNLLKTPCLDCNDRTSDCHGKCKAYIQWVEEYRKAKRKNIGEYYARDFIIWRASEIKAGRGKKTKKKETGRW